MKNTVNNLFTIVHPYSNPNKDFSITINHPIWITNDAYEAKVEAKRVLLEMVDTYPKLILAYSGGTDSAFILCCIRDLINEVSSSRKNIKKTKYTFFPLKVMTFILTRLISLRYVHWQTPQAQKIK